MKNSILAIFFILHISIFGQNKEYVLYKDSTKTSDLRTKDLLSRMTDDDKALQLMSVWLTNFSYIQDNGELDINKMKRKFGEGMNSLQPSFADIEKTVKERNLIQDYLMNYTRLGIPSLFIDEGLHGLMRPQSTVFPSALGMASSWNPELIEKVYHVVAHEMRSRGTTLALSPVIDISLDPRWGRTEETFGEDPYLTGRLGVAAIKGFQGSSDGTIDKNHVGATLKHFTGHGVAEGGINQAPANVSLRNLYEKHFPPFREGIKEANPIAVMPSYNEIDGVPSHINKWLLKEVLRKQLGFQGMIISDYYGINQLEEKHKVTADVLATAEKSFNAGVELEMPSPNYFKKIPELIQLGRIKRDDVDRAVYKVLKYKFDLGLFDHSKIDIKEAVKVSKLQSSKDLALQAAQQSIILLKNDGTLPLDKRKIKKIAVIGPGADKDLYGGYSGAPYEGVSLLQGIQKKVGKNVEIVTAEGVKFTKNATNAHDNWQIDLIEFPSHTENLALIKEAMEVAKKADVIILAVGENEQLSREAWSKIHHGDNNTLDLVSDQQELADSLLSLGKPLVVYLQNGRPLSIKKLNNDANAVIEGWYMGQHAGTAAADVLFGDVNPSGKLTITIPKSVGQLPLFYNHKPSAQSQDYISEDIEPLYPFGYGLSYTTFEYSKPRLSDSEISINGNTVVTVKVTNTGNLKGDEIVQMYIRDEVSSVTRPVKELKDFQRISLALGESKEITFKIDSSKLSFWNLDMKNTVEPGKFKIMVGPSSNKIQEVELIVK